MLKMLNKMKSLHRDGRGITGLETAIILIAFVVVASVFAYTVISAGMFSSQKGQEVIYAGLEEARTTIALKGDVIVKDTDSDNDLDEVIFTVVSIAEGEPVDLTEPTDTTPVDGLADTGSGNVAVISYADASNRYTDLAWTTTILGKGDADDLLEAGEKFQITVDLQATGGVGPKTTFTIELKQARGNVLEIERTTPAAIDDVMILR